MKSLRIKTKEVSEVFQILNGCKYTKLEDADKVKVWKIGRALRPVAEKFNEDSQSAAESMKPTEDFSERFQQAQEYEKAKSENRAAPISEDEYMKFVDEFRKYNDLVNKAINDYAEKEVELEIETISEDAFGKLMSSNEWTVAQTMKVEIIVE